MSGQARASRGRGVNNIDHVAENIATKIEGYVGEATRRERREPFGRSRRAGKVFPEHATIPPTSTAR